MAEKLKRKVAMNMTGPPGSILNILKKIKLDSSKDTPLSYNHQWVSMQKNYTHLTIPSQYWVYLWI